jgi:hypothetical protein
MSGAEAAGRRRQSGPVGERGAEPDLKPRTTTSAGMAPSLVTGDQPGLAVDLQP